MIKAEKCLAQGQAPGEGSNVSPPCHSGGEEDEPGDTETCHEIGGDHIWTFSLGYQGVGLQT